MNSEERKAYMKAWKEAHKESEKAKLKAWKEANKDKCKAYDKAWCESHKEQRKAKNKAWREANKEYMKAYKEAHKEECNAYMKEYYKTDVNSHGQTKASIRQKSQRILKKMNLHIPGYEIHHCFTYDDASKFIYISKSLHLKIHKYLRDNNIDADADHWMQIRHIVNSADEFMYIKC